MQIKTLSKNRVPKSIFMQLKDKNIILGITGGIAAYKSAFLCRLLIKEGANVKVVMTPSAKEFITPVTMATLSKNTVLIDFFKHDDGAWNSHVDLGLWADAMLIAPATASTIGKMANGIADNLLITTYLSCKAPVILAPAMDLDMYRHPSTARNMKVLESYGNILIEPSSGELASGLEGKGRMEEPEEIVKELINFFSSKKKLQAKLANKHFLVTAGPTYEKIDPVRFIGNFSTGKMGYAIAETLANAGAKVTLVSGPVSITVKHQNITCIDVMSAQEMHNESVKVFPDVDGAIMSAAVADYTPKTISEGKIKRKSSEIEIQLTANPDIAADLGALKKKNQLLIGFALETSNGIENAKGKLEKKNLDFIVLNSLNEEGSGFGYDTNKITIIDQNNKIEKFELKTKKEVSLDIVNKIINWSEKI